MATTHSFKIGQTIYQHQAGYDRKGFKAANSIFFSLTEFPVDTYWYDQLDTDNFLWTRAFGIAIARDKSIVTHRFRNHTYHKFFTRKIE